MQAIIENGHGECSSANVAEETKKKQMEASRGGLPQLQPSDKEGRGLWGQRELAAYFVPVLVAFPWSPWDTLLV